MTALDFETYLDAFLDELFDDAYACHIHSGSTVLATDLMHRAGPGWRAEFGPGTIAGIVTLVLITRVRDGHPMARSTCRPFLVANIDSVGINWIPTKDTT